MSSGSGWNIIVRCGIHNHDLAKSLDDHDILGRLKFDERHFVNDMTRYHMTSRFIVIAFKDRGSKI